jgi:hypothetical protein
MLTEALVLARNREFVWMKLSEIWPYKVLTMPRNTLPRGMANALVVEVDVDPGSLYATDVHYRANLEVVGVIRRGNDDLSDCEEGTGEAEEAD